MSGGRIPGALGQPHRSLEDVRDGTGGQFASPQPGPLGATVGVPSLSDRIGALLHGVELDRLADLAVAALGPEAFGVGVIVGAGTSMVASLSDLADLVRVFVMADLADGLYPRTHWATLLMAGRPMLLAARVIALPPPAERALRDARDEREALIEAVRYAIEHPGEVFEKVADEWRAKWRRYESLQAENSLRARYEAGKILGELLMVLLPVLAGGAGLARLVAQVPKLARAGSRLAQRIERAAAAVTRRQGPVSARRAEVVRTTPSASRSAPIEDTVPVARRLAYRPTSGAVLEASPGRTTTVLGNYQNDMQHVIGEMGNVKSTDFGSRPGGFNVLNVPDELYRSPEQFWSEYNRPWLDRAIERGDRMVLATEPNPNVMVRTNRATGLDEMTGFGREVQYLQERGFRYDAATHEMVRTP